ncbi:HET-domain-containing protein [Hypoxylon rubiginosum]|uniref:HET-domain-containing protein n=1 Tax=Hypoxylon rubiginosum TaxID=110542 RepID=A0ACB9Z2X4_9PEZI|nr:HET-domain-containing protein [Hypoxylon rubiginosum]
MIAPTQRYLLTLRGVPNTADEHRFECITIEPSVNTLPGVYEPCENIPLSSDSLKAFELARRWLYTCRANHTKCAFTSESFTTSRILDVSLEDPKLLLREDLQDAIEYIALSHCWGKSQPLKTVRDNLDSHRKRIPFETLPATFKDAVKLTRRLGLRYLWIDSLCILQDEDKEDWERQASQMEKVYGNAELVLAATVASSPEDGFLRNRPSFDVSSVSTLLDDQTIPIESRYRFIYKHDYFSGENGPLDNRAWAFQERLLARRYLAYGNSEMRWECCLDSFCECGWVSTEEKRYDRDSNLDNMLETLASPQERKQLWDYINTEYARRELTVASDRLVALSAVASRFQSEYGNTYLAGLWKENIVYFLAWYVRSRCKPASFYAPSWSWFSVDAKDLMFPLSPRDEIILATVMDASVTISTVNKFGPVSKGHIRLRSSAIEAILHVEMQKVAGTDIEGYRIEIPGLPYETGCLLDTPVVAYDLKQGDGTEQIEAHARRISHTETSLRREYPSKYSVLVLPILIGDMFIHSLVLGRSSKHPGCRERLGGSSWRRAIGIKVMEFLTRYEDTELVIV